MTISNSKVSFTLKYSIATFLLCTSAFATGVFIYPISLAIFSATAIPIFFVAVASISSIIALSSAIYLIKSAVSEINDKNMCSILEEKSHCNDISEKIPIAAVVQSSLPTSNSKEPITNSAKAPEKVPVMSDTVIPQAPPLPPPFPMQVMTVSPPLLLIQTLKDCKSPNDDATGKSQSSFNVQSSDSSVDMLKQIRAGIKLKKVEKLKIQNEENAVNSGSLAAILARRMAISSPSTGSSHSEAEFDWSDHDQDIRSRSKKEEKFMSGTEIQKSVPVHDLNVTSSQTKPNSTPFLPLPSPLPNQSTGALSPSLLLSEDLKNSKPIEDREISKMLLDSTSLKNSSFTKSKKRLEKIEKESEHSQDLWNEKIKDNRDNAKEETRQEYVEETKKQQKEKNKVEGQNDNDWIRNIILELIPPSVKLTDVKKVESSGFSSGYSSDLENHSI